MTMTNSPNAESNEKLFELLQQGKIQEFNELRKLGGYTSLDLRTAVLIGANLIGASLNEDDLSGANLSGANLTSAILSGANLS